jgi:hypothetical protein
MRIRNSHGDISKKGVKSPNPELRILNGVSKNHNKSEFTIK